MSKLVRDKIPDIMIAKKQTPKIKVIKNDSEYLEALHEKLSEEVNEFIESSIKNNNEEAMQEIADILEVIEAICKYKKYSRDSIQDFKSRKKQERGGFEKRILLIKD